MPRRPVGRRLNAALALAALVSTTLLASGLALAPAVSAGTAEPEVCRSCQGCEYGRCDESSPQESGDHCCASSCLAHAEWALSALPPPPAPASDAQTVPSATPSPLQSAPGEISQPPRG